MAGLVQNYARGGRNINFVTSHAVFMSIFIAYLVVAWWALLRSGRKRTSKQQKPSFHDQVMYELKKFDAAVERGAKRREEQALAAANLAIEK